MARSWGDKVMERRTVIIHRDVNKVRGYVEGGLSLGFLIL